jgi:hypothetical protein
MTGSEVALPDTATAQALARPTLYDRMDPQQLAVLKSTVAAGADDAELAYFLELAGHLDLNPFAHEIWCAKSRGRDGGKGRLLVMVGRDGLLKVARRTPGYLGYDADVIHENDTFERREPNPEAASMRGRAGVHHVYGHPKDRGAVLGAWAVAEREGEPPRFFYADLAEYMPKSPDSYSPWSKQPSVMIDKVAISLVHRTLFSITGIHVEEEMARVLDAEAIEVDESIPWPDGEVGERIRFAVEEINNIEPNTYPPAVLQMMLAGQADDVLEKLMRDVEKELVQLAAFAEQVPVPKLALPPQVDVESVRARLDRLHDDLVAAVDADDQTRQDEITVEIDHLDGLLKDSPEVSADQTQIEL